MLRRFFVHWVPFSLLLSLSIPCIGQSIISGDVTGTVTDPTDRRISGATVNLTNINTNNVRTATTGADGSYRFAFVTPGNYTVTVIAKGFQTAEHTGIVVSAGPPVAANVQLAVATATQSITVVEATQVLQTENADVSTTYNSQMIQNLPNPGSDLTYFAQTAPGVVMNTQAGYGNFVADGMPSTSNLFTINGVNSNDPFLGLNNSGASNLMLGSNDVAEANVTTNGYSGQYGQYAGPQITYITKSGNNSFHGNAVYMWNGRELNANQFFSNAVGLPTPFNNFNQWQTNVNGPIWKNHTFFDADYEGLRNLLPSTASLSMIPSPQFQAATLTNLVAQGHSDEIPFYKQIFSIYNNAPNTSSAVPVPGGGCQGFTGLPAGVPCALQFRSTPTSLNKEYLYSGRVDHIFSEKDRAYIRVSRDNGFQPTYTSPFGPTFNFQSNQPQMNGLVSWTHTFDANTLNEFKGSAFFYAASFIPTDEAGALAALPTFVAFSGNPFTPVGFGEPPYPPGSFFPQGRRVFQYQILDDFSKIKGKHTFRVGFSWLHQNVTDLDFSGVGGPINGALQTSLSDFFNGGGAATSLNQAFPSSLVEHLKFNTFGGYLADDLKLSSRLTISLNLRFENYANPTCEANCFARLSTQFTGIPNPAAGATPYNLLVVPNQHTAYPNTQTLLVQPRIGVAWQPFQNGNTVVRFGGGFFNDELPGGLAEGAAFNPPGFVALTLPNGALAPGAAGSLFTTAAQANQALVTGFKSGGSFNSISQAVPGFVPPNFTNFPNTFFQPTYYRWNFEVQQSLGWRTVLKVNYSGMHGKQVPIGAQAINAYCPPSVCPGGFAGLPAAPPSAAFGTVNQYFSAGNSNYNGVTISLQRRISQGLTFNLNYTWSHALDDVSNGGIVNEPFSFLATNVSITTPQNPFNFRANYGNSAYDVRNYLSASLVLTDMFRHAGMRWGPNSVFGGWTLSSNIFYRSGLPFTIIDGANTGALEGYNLGVNTFIFASPQTKIPGTCTNAVNSPCLDASQFTPAGALTGFGTIGRNSVYGPHFFNMDLSLMKDVRITEHVTFSFGAQAYNLLNHPNFDQPVADISNPQFGSSIATVGPPTSLLGAFVGAGSSPRFLEIKGLVRF